MKISFHNKNYFCEEYFCDYDETFHYIVEYNVASFENTIYQHVQFSRSLVQKLPPRTSYV